MSLDLYGFVDPTFASRPEGGVTLLGSESDGYYDDDGIWVPPTQQPPRTLANVSIQPASKKTVEMMIGMGGTANPRDLRELWINDGTMLYPEDDGRAADRLEFSDGLAVRTWKVVQADNRPWHTYCHAIVERVRT